MKDRCNREKSPVYKNYGGRGIKLCDEWEHNFQAFYDWAISHGYSSDLTIERKDVNKGYCPENCCWITREEQARNKRNLRMVEIDGEEVTLKEACRRMNLPYQAVHLRITRYGMSVEDALNTPFIDKKNCLAQKCRDHGLPYGTVRARIKAGWSEERALSEPIHEEKGPRRKQKE